MINIGPRGGGKAMKKLMLLLCLVIHAYVFAQENFVFTDRTSEKEFSFIWEQFNKKGRNFVDQSWFFAKNVWTCTKININRDEIPNTIDKVLDKYEFEMAIDENNKTFTVPYALFTKIIKYGQLPFSYSNYQVTNEAVFESNYQLNDALPYTLFIRFSERATFYFVNTFNVTKADEYEYLHGLGYSYAEEYQLSGDSPYVINHASEMLAVTSVGVCRSNRR